ncbi:phosphogluconate dehydratase [Limnobacter sp.]|uniref:phosphogluconate dehydratase n=1 Tax=Limnobacter sp. TaxID=2003368 RepID=UPI00258ACE55|nr:phosphogluconate dehydratase [Limnobacter sp.]HEX5485116.1 phosphogluconate dehydratase [Limnobacter sp.]
MSPLHPTLLKVRQRIEKRSAASRAQYLDSLPAGPSPRTSMGCANLAHATAVFPTADKFKIAVEKAPHLGIVTAYNDMLSAHQPFAVYPAKIAGYAQEVGVTTQVAGGTPAMCDGITQGREGMELSLFSRDVIALSACVGLSHDVFDGGILLGVCDKIAPGLLIGALAFGHLPFVFIPAGPMSSGLSNPEKAKIRQLASEGKADRATLLRAEEAAYHSSGTCTFYGTANSNQLMLDFMGLQYPGGAFCAPNSPERERLIQHSVHAIARAAAPDHRNVLKLAELVNSTSLLNALVGLMASGGSTNHTIHWITVARAAGYLIDWTDLDEISSVTPLLTRVYPNGTEDVNAFHAAGGTGYLLRTLIEGGFVDGSAMTSFGCSLGECLDGLLQASSQSSNLDVLRPHTQPFQPDGGIRLLQGNLGRSVCKVSAVKQVNRSITAPCRVFSDQHEVIEAFERDEFTQDVVVVVIHQGPKANGMPELHKLTPVLGVLQDRGLAVALVTDGRMSGASGKVLAAIHVSPEAMQDGPIGKLRDGDLIRIDADHGVLQTDADLKNRKVQTMPARSGNLGRSYFNAWRRAVSGAEQGATHLFEEF